MTAVCRVTSLPLVLLHSCLQFADTPSLLRFGRTDRAALTAVDHPLAWNEQHEDGETTDEDEEESASDAVSDQTVPGDGDRTDIVVTSASGDAVAVPTRSASLAPLTLGRGQKRWGARVVLLHSQHTQHLTHQSLVRSHAAVHFISHAATGHDMAAMLLCFHLPDALRLVDAAALAFPPFDAEMEFTALSHVQHLERLFVCRSHTLPHSLDDDHLRALLQLPHVRRSLRGVYLTSFGFKETESRRPMMNAFDGLVRRNFSTRRVPPPLVPPAEYFSLPTLQLMSALPHLHTLCISDGATAYGLLPMLHKYMPQLTTLAFTESQEAPELPSSDVMSIGLCPRLHTLMLTGSCRWNTSGPNAGYLFLPFFSQPLLQRNLRRLHLIGIFRFDDVLLPVLSGLRALRAVACGQMMISILPALIELTREDRDHQPHRHSHSSSSDSHDTVDGDEAVLTSKSKVRELIIFVRLREDTLPRLYSSLPFGSPLMVYLRPNGLGPQYTPVDSVWRFQSAAQTADLEMVRELIGGIDSSFLGRLVMCPRQPQVFGPAHLHDCWTTCWGDLLQFDWVRLDRAHIVSCPLPAAVSKAVDTARAAELAAWLAPAEARVTKAPHDAAATDSEENRLCCSTAPCNSRQFSSAVALKQHRKAKHPQHPIAAAAASTSMATGPPSVPQAAFRFESTGATFTVDVSSSPGATPVPVRSHRDRNESTGLSRGGAAAASAAPSASAADVTISDDPSANSVPNDMSPPVTNTTRSRVIVKVKRRAPKESSEDSGAP